MVAKKNNPQFILDARAIHGNKFEYLAPYQTAIKKIDIFCNTCFHTFKQTPNAHLDGQGCPVCGARNLLASRLVERDKAAALFIERATKVHGDRYDYSETKYGKNCDTRIPVICRTHGEFLVSPSNHLKGKGCPSCAKTGFDPAKVSYLYLLAAVTREHGEVVKVGITNVPKVRLAQNKKNDRIPWKMIRLVRYPDGYLPRAFEKILLDYLGTTFKGKERFVCPHAEAVVWFDAITVSSRQQP